ncbi:MAG: hypothetical protein NWE78_08095, partial [Candidatus Bathyarchaeota archaeon]|nr:hypothetical protein [Candidatus Bathyarchaeota archaeon]
MKTALKPYSSSPLERLIFATIVSPDKSSETSVMLLAESIRTFAGSLSQTPIWCFVPENGKPISAHVKEELVDLNVTLIPFKIDYEIQQFPFADLVLATALAESVARGKTDLLAWLATNTIVVQEPKNFLLQDGKNLGFRPVHHTLVGSRFDEPLDPFWKLIYNCCNVPQGRVFPMMTHVDDVKIRPYFNAGLLVTRPDKCLFHAWRNIFFRVYQNSSFQEFYQQDIRYKIFIHQAVLSGVILSTFATTEVQEFPPSYNYPLHLHKQDVTKRRPSYLEEVVTFRHEG